MKIKLSQLGFSLVEVLVAVSILLLFVTGPMQIITSANRSTGFASQQVNAFLLAQEGLELAEKGRDDLLLQYYRREIYNTGLPMSTPMTSYVTQFANCFLGAGCDLTISGTPQATINITSCTPIASCRLYIDMSSSRSVYNHNTNAEISPYTRVIKMERLPASGKIREIKVTSTVTWRTGSFIAGQSVTLVTYLENTYDTN